MKKVMTLCIIQKDDQVLLGMKKRGFGAGRWNGFGGKTQEGENIEEAAQRELYEEAGLRASDLMPMGVLDFSFENDPKILEVHVFRATEVQGTPIETEEMKPQWFAIDNIPYHQMWSDDEHWLPLLLAGKKFKGDVFFDTPSTEKYSARIIKKSILML